MLLLVLPATLLAIPDEFKPVLRPTMNISRTASTISIDGRLGDPGWANAAHVNSFVERSPGDNTRPEETTDVYMTYDDTKLYVAFVCHDNPSLLRATMSQRDQYSGDDVVCLLLDTYGDGAWAYQLFVNSYGIQKDILWTNMGNGSQQDSGFDLIWESAAQRTDSGYTVEMAIPFASLRFPDRPEQSWRVDFWRNRPREVLKQYSWAANDRNESCFPCLFGTVSGIRDVHPGRGLQVLPSMVAHQTGGMVDPYDASSAFRNNNAKAELSLGGKYSLSSDMTAEATVNPDFSQIEADAAQIDVNSTVSLFYPERRPFFQEGSDIFQTPFNSFYSRTINNPQFASKFTMRHGRTRLGVIAAYDDNSPYMIPLDASSYSLDLGKSFSTVMRGSQQIGNNNQLGFFVADRRFDGGGSGTVLSADGRLRLSKSYSTGIQYIFTNTAEPNFASTFAKGKFDGGKHTAALDGESYSGDAIVTQFSRNARHWNFYLGYNQISPTYRTENGFDPVNNHRTADIYSNYTFYPSAGPFVQIVPQFSTERRWDFLTGICRYNTLKYELQAQSKLAQTQIDLSYNTYYERWRGVLFGALDYYNLNLDSRFSNKLGAGGYVTAGRGLARYAMARGRMLNYGIYMSIKPVDRLTIEPQLDYARMSNLENGERFFSGYIMHTRLQFQGTKALSFRLVLQYDDFGKVWNVDPLVTYRLSPFSLFYIGSAVDYTQFNGDSGAPNGSTIWRNSNRQVFMKIQYLFQT
jgi:hypothetical protein